MPSLHEFGTTRYDPGAMTLQQQQLKPMMKNATFLVNIIFMITGKFILEVQ